MWLLPSATSGRETRRAHGLSRRALLGLGIAWIASPALGQTQGPAAALANDIARLLRQGLDGDMMRAAQRIFAEADGVVIAQTVLRSAAEQVAPARLREIGAHFAGQMARRLAARAAGFAGGSLTPGPVQPVGRYHEIAMELAAPDGQRLDLRWHASDRSGRMRPFNLLLGGENLLALQREEFAVLLGAAGGDAGEALRRLGL